MFKRSFFIAVIALFLLKCSNKLDILAPYKESVAVYGLINQNDSVQYIRVQRVFLGEGNAISIAQNPDSCYYKPGELKVTLQRILNSAQVGVDNTSGGVPTGPNEIVLTEAYVQVQPGVFSTTQLLYKTNHKLYDGSRYKLVIHSNKSGKEFTSSNVGLIGNFSSPACLAYGLENSQLIVRPPLYQAPFVPSNKGTVVCKYNSPPNAAVCGLKVRFYYTEFPGGVKYVEMDQGSQYLVSDHGGIEVDLSYVGDAMLQNVSNLIPVDPNVNHRVADSLHFILYGAGFDLSVYNQVSGSTSLSQSKPTYTNISNGIGVFSSRKDYYIFHKIQDASIQRLADDPLTCPLHFYTPGSNGNLATTCP